MGDSHTSIGAETSLPEDHVNRPDAAWLDMEASRRVMRALKSTRDFLAADMLLRNPRESAADHERRKAVLYVDPFAWGSAELLGGQPFGKPCSITAPTRLAQMIEDDVDGKGSDLCSFARRVCIPSVAYGVQYLHVHVPEDMDRPVMSHVSEAAVIGSPVSGAPLRIRSSRVVRPAATPWLAKRIPQVHVYRTAAQSGGAATTLEIHEPVDPEKPSGKWAVQKVIEIGELTDLPVVPIPTGGKSPSPDLVPWHVRPPQEELSRHNLAYVLKLSDRDRHMHYAAAGQICYEGSAEELAEALALIEKLGPGVVWPGRGKFYMLDTGVEALSHSLDDLEYAARKMLALGSMPQIERASGPARTATGERRDSAGDVTKAQSWASDWEDGFTKSARLMARIMRLDADVSISFDRDFGPALQDAANAQIIRADYLEGVIDDDTYFRLMVEMGVYPPSSNVEELAAIAKARRAAQGRVSA